MSSRTILAARILGGLAVIFGLMTLKAGGSVIFDLGTARVDHGHYVPFVLWFNSLTGFAYIAAGVGLWLRRRWAAHLSVVLVLGLVAISLGLAAHVASGGAYDSSTLTAMGIRLTVWGAIALFSLAALFPSLRGNKQAASGARGQP